MFSKSTLKILFPILGPNLSACFSKANTIFITIDCKLDFLWFVPSLLYRNNILTQGQ